MAVAAALVNAILGVAAAGEARFWIWVLVAAWAGLWLLGALGVGLAAWRRRRAARYGKAPRGDVALSATAPRHFSSGAPAGERAALHL